MLIEGEVDEGEVSGVAGARYKDYGGGDGGTNFGSFGGGVFYFPGGVEWWPGK